MRVPEPAPAPSRTRPAKRRAKRYGWIPDLPDQRDHMFSAPLGLLRPLPERVDLRGNCPPVYDQGELGSCTANAIAAALEFDQLKQRSVDVFVPSRLFIYYNERAIEGTVNEDAGAMLRDGMKSVAKDGAPHERLWPYAISRFRSRPTLTSYTDAARHPAVLYQRLTQDLAQLKGCLASGFPFVFGFAVYESFESESVAKTGNVSLPDPSERQLGGHAVMAIGYDEGERRFFVRNSWGPEWGTSGYGSMPFDYLLDGNLSDDFWTIRSVR